MSATVFIATPLVPTYSETFLRAHLTRLPYKVVHLHSDKQRGLFPVYANQKPLFTNLLPVNYLETAAYQFLNIQYPMRRRAIAKLIAQHQPKALMAEYGILGAVLAPVAAENKLPLIVHFHGKDAYHYKTLEKYQKDYQKMFKQAAALIAVSSDMVEQLVHLGADRAKIHLNPCSPNAEIFTPRSEEAAKNTSAQFLSVGRFCAKKAPLNTIDAFNIALQKHPNATLIMVGDGELWEKAKQHAKANKIDHAITFAGKLPPQEIAKLMHSSRAYVQHSLRAADGDSEGTPVSIMEAMASGVAVISTRHAGIKEVVLHTQTGLLANEGDVATMGKQIIQLIENPMQAAAMGKAGAERVAQHYTMQMHMDRLTQVFKAVSLSYNKH